MSSHPSTRIPSRGIRSSNIANENVRPTRSTLGRAGKTLIAQEKPANIALDPPVKTSFGLRANVNADQQENIAPAKRKRAALGDVTKLKNKTESALDPVGKLPTKRATGVSSNIAGTTATNASRRQPLATKSKNDAVTTDSHPVHPLPKRTAVQQTTKSAIVPATTTTTKSRRTLSSSNATDAISRKHIHKTSTHVRSRTVTVIVDEEPVDAEDDHVHKKRRISEDDVEVDLELKDEVITSEAEIVPAIGSELVKPEDQEPEDLDAADMDDPLMVAEYVGEIFEYLKDVEINTMANPEYIKFQKALQWRMRGILADWLISVHRSCRMLPETIFIAINLVDRFLSARTVSVDKLQLVGVTCLLIAAKYEEICAPSIKTLVFLCQDSCTEAQIQEAEKYILKTVNWNLSYPSPITFLRRISKADGFDAQSRTVAKYLMEIYCVEWRLIGHPPSAIAAAAMWLSRLVLARPEWDANLAHYSGYKEAQLLPTACLMLNYILKPTRHENLHNKYASQKYSKASVHVRHWALQRWDEGEVVDLAAVCDTLKAQAAQARQMLELEDQAEEELR